MYQLQNMLLLVGIVFSSMLSAQVPEGAPSKEAPSKEAVDIPGAKGTFVFKPTDLFDCNAWCVGSGNRSGMCVVAQAEPCGASARCECQ